MARRPTDETVTMPKTGRERPPLLLRSHQKFSMLAHRTQARTPDEPTNSSQRNSTPTIHEAAVGIRSES
uniref:Uncharacterized protein n=1 Tax=Angiostrongylus cantonensis TaxID=6313 RepID=A0A0K0DHN6_ANGCA